MRVLEFLEADGRSPFRHWFDRLDAQAAAKVTVALVRIEQGNLSGTKSVGRGVHEFRMVFGPGYRLYFGRDGDELIILLGGGTKKRQANDIEKAYERWADYQKRKRSMRHGSHA